MSTALEEHVLPYEYCETGSGDPVDSENLVEFRLLYEGELLPSGNRNTRSPEKHAIRSVLHPQLRRQWQVNSALRQLAVHLGNQYDPVALEGEQERFDHGIKAIGSKWAMFGYHFASVDT